MAEIVGGLLTWGALKLTSSLVTAGWNKLIGNSEGGDHLCPGADEVNFEWGGDIVLKARDRSVPDEMMRGLRSGLGVAAAELSGVRHEVQQMKYDSACVREMIQAYHNESMEFFRVFTESLEATQQGFEAIQNAPLKVAEMALNNYTASRGKIKFLEVAHDNALTAFAQGHTLDVKLSAATIAVAAGYIHMSKVDSPSEAKSFTVGGTLKNIVDLLAPIWADPDSATTPAGRKTLMFLLGLVSSVCVLPPASEVVLPALDKRLLSAIGRLCAIDHVLRRRYDEVGGEAVRAMLDDKSLLDLCLLAGEIDVDITHSKSAAQVIQNLLDSEKALAPGVNAVSAVRWPDAGRYQPVSVYKGNTDTQYYACRVLAVEFNRYDRLVSVHFDVRGEADLLPPSTATLSLGDTGMADRRWAQAQAIPQSLKRVKHGREGFATEAGLAGRDAWDDYFGNHTGFRRNKRGKRCTGHVTFRVEDFDQHLRDISPRHFAFTTRIQLNFCYASSAPYECATLAEWPASKAISLAEALAKYHVDGGEFGKYAAGELSAKVAQSEREDTVDYAKHIGFGFVPYSVKARLEWWA